MKGETEKTKFFYQLKLYGLKKVLISFDFIIALIILIFSLIDRFYDLHIFYNGDDNSIVVIFVAASTLFSITLAILAILLSLSGSDFMNFLKQKRKLHSLLFPFWLGNLSYLAVIALSTVYLILSSEIFNCTKGYLYSFIISIFIYGVMSTFYLLATIIRFGYFLDIYEKAKGKNRES